MKRIGVFVDISNLYYCVEKKYKKKIDYSKYISYIKDLGAVDVQIAYAAVLGNESQPFLHALKELGFEVKTKTPKEYAMANGGVKHKCDHDVQMAMDIVNQHENLDQVVLGSADGDMTPVVQWLKDRRISTVVLACGISRELRECAKLGVEIPPSMLIG